MEHPQISCVEIGSPKAIELRRYALVDLIMRRYSAYFRPKTPEWFPTRKAAQVVAYFAIKAGGRINVLLCSKLVSLADRLSMERRDYSITGDNFVSMDFGPVASNTYDYMKGNASVRQGEWAEFVAPRDNYDLPLAKGVTTDILDELSRSDLKILAETWDKFSDIDKYELAEWTHQFCPEWRDPGRSSIPIEFPDLFKELGKEDPDELAQDLESERKLKLTLFTR